MNGSGRWGAVTLVLFGAISYGLVTCVFKLAANDGWEVSRLTFLQVLSGTAMLWLTTVVRRLRLPASSFVGGWKAALRIGAIGVVGMSLTTVFYNEALARLNVSLGIVLLFQFTWITILLESIRRRKLPSVPERIAVVCVAAGTVLAVGLLNEDLGRLDAWGIVFGLLSAVTYALFFFLTDFLPAGTDPFAKSAVMSTASLAFIAIATAPWTFDWSGSGSTELYGWGLLLGFLGTAFPFVCFNAGIPKLGGGLAALLGSMELPAAIVAAYYMLGESLNGWKLTGIALILAGIAAAQRKSGTAVSAGEEGDDRL